MKFRYSNRGLSTIVAVLLLVLLTVVLVGVVVKVVTDIVDEGLDKSESCFDTFGKISLNGEYTCYNSSGNEIQFSLNREDIEVDKIVVSISAESSSRNIELLPEGSVITNLKPYQGEFGNPVSLPEKKGGKTYVYDWGDEGFVEKPKSIVVVPVINGNMCEAVEELYEIGTC